MSRSRTAGPLTPETTPRVLRADAVRLGLRATDRQDALRQCGAVLVQIGAAGPAYAEAMLEREQLVSTYMGMGFAIPHGTDASREHINRAALAFLQFPDGVDWDGRDCHVCIAIASKSDEQLWQVSLLLLKANELPASVQDLLKQPDTVTAASDPR